MTYRIEFDEHEDVVEETCPRAAGHAFRRITRRRGWSPFWLELRDDEGKALWDLEWTDRDLWLQPEDFVYLLSVDADSRLIRLVWINGNQLTWFRRSEEAMAAASELRKKRGSA